MIRHPNSFDCCAKYLSKQRYRLGQDASTDSPSLLVKRGAARFRANGIHNPPARLERSTVCWPILHRQCRCRGAFLVAIFRAAECLIRFAGDQSGRVHRYEIKPSRIEGRLER